MTKKLRDFRAEYARRKARGLARGLTLSQARGHRRVSEEGLARHKEKAVPDAQLQYALKRLRHDKSLLKAAKAAKLSPEKLRSIALERGLVERKGRSWQIRDQLPRQMRIFSEGRAVKITVTRLGYASEIGRYWNAVKRFLGTNNPKHLKPFEGVVIADRGGTLFTLETDPNTLYRLNASGDQAFENIYRILI